MRPTGLDLSGRRVQQESVTVFWRTDGAEEDAGVRSREDGLKADAVATGFPNILSSLVGDPLGHRHGADPSGLETVREGPWLCGSEVNKRNIHNNIIRGVLNIITGL